MRRTAVTMMVVFAGCTSAEPPRPKLEEAPAKAAEEAKPAAPEARPEPAEEPLSLQFSAVLEGLCPHLDVSLVGGETFVHAEPGAWIGRVLPEGGFEDMSVVLRREHDMDPYYVSIGQIEAVEGGWPDDLWLRYLQVDGRIWEGSRYLKRKEGAWVPLATAEDERKSGGVEQLFQWTGGNWLGRIGCRDECKEEGLWLRVIRGPGKAPKFPELRGKEEGCWSNYAMTVLPGGEIAAVGRFCHKPRELVDGAWYGVFWSEAGGTKIERLPVQGHGKRPGPIVGISPTQTVAAITGAAGEPAVLFAYNGASWTAMPPVEGKFAGVDVDAAGTVWLAAGGRLARSAGGGAWEGMSFPTGPVKQVGGLREAVAWATQEDGALWLRPPGGEFTRVELPTPVFSAAGNYEVEAVRSAGREVWVTASYAEKGTGWQEKERRRAVLRNGGVREALRCAEDGNHVLQKGTMSWPPAAREGCQAPFAILVRASSWAGKQHKYPELGKLLKGKQEFAGLKFSEIEFGGLRIAGAAVPNLAVGRALVELVGAGIKRARPELVCAAPTELRALPFDLTTGKLKP